MQADPAFGETPGGLQAPYVWREDAPLTCGGGPATQPAGASRPWVMAYGDWVHLCLARSDDGKHFERCLMPDGRAGMFDEGPESNARDAMVIRIDRERDGRRVPTWYCYYTAHPGNVGAVYCRTSTDLRTWSASRVVARGGRSGTEFNSAECPFVVVMDGYYYLFRTQRYGEHMLTNVYRSTDPLDFGVDSDAHYIQELPVAAPEVFEHDGRWYIAHLRRDLKGIQIAPLRWDEDRRSEQGGGT